MCSVPCQALGVFRVLVAFLALVFLSRGSLIVLESIGLLVVSRVTGISLCLLVVFWH